MSRLVDNERRFGPVTFGWSGWNPLRIVLSSGDREEESRYRNTLTCYAFGWVARINLPNVIRPYAIRKQAGWDEATVKRLGRDWYENTYPREYGFCLHEGFLQIFYGVQRHDGERGQHWCKHLPWTQKRVVRFDYLNLEGEPFWTAIGEQRGHEAFERQYKAKETIPKAHYLLRDYDGTPITATVHLEQRIYRQGEGWFKWLGWLCRPEVVRRADISFNGETGPEKGSWKGGTMGCSTPIDSGDLHIDAIKKYCAKDQRAKYRNYRIEFIGEAPCTTP